MSLSNDSIAFYLPKELLESLQEVIRVGLNDAKIPREDRNNIKNWWEVELNYLEENISKNKII